MSKQIVYPTIKTKNKCTFNVWSPGAAQLSVIDLTGEREIALEKTGEKGYWKKEADNCAPGMRYKYRIDGGDSYPDPADEKTFEKSMLSWRIGNSKEKQAMFEYYKALIKLRREHPVLKVPDKKNMRVSEFERSVIVERWQKDDFILAIINFGTKGGSAKIPAGLKGKFIKVIDSAEEKWSGPGDSAPELITANDQIAMPESSILIYSKK